MLLLLGLLLLGLLLVLLVVLLLALLLLLLLLFLPVLAGPAGAAAGTAAASSVAGIKLNAAAASLQAGASVGSRSGCRIMLNPAVLLQWLNTQGHAPSRQVAAAGDRSFATAGLACCCCCRCCMKAARLVNALVKPSRRPAQEK
jgi:hypothetical protein